MDDTFAQLEAEYCPPLDPALLSAILSDYNIWDAQSLENAKETLNALKEDAQLEDAAGFDPSGTGAADDGSTYNKRPVSLPETSGSISRETELTRLSNDLSSLEIDDDDRVRHVEVEHTFEEPEGFEEFEEDVKVERLQDLVGQQVNRYSIQHALRNCNGNWNGAVDELLTQAFFAGAESGADGSFVNVKGIEAFSEENVARSGRKSRAKNKQARRRDQRRSSSLPGLHNDEELPAKNKWKSASEDIEYIAARCGIATATVSSIYHEKGASVPKTIATLLTASMEESKHIVSDETPVSSEAQRLGHDFPTISTEYLTALVRLTHPSSAAAHDLAKALTSKPKDVNGGGIQIIPQYTLPNLSDADQDWRTAVRKARSATSLRPSSQDISTATAQRDTYSLARAAAYSQASAAHRKSKSDRLMGGAAAYYSEVGREYAALSSAASAQTADALVASQSNAAQLDLHGVDVLNAVRIARERVEEWWNGLGESRVNGRVGAEERQAGYRIVVGLGRHSEGGKGKLGPAVTKVLREEGWRVEANGAVVVVVKGPMRR